MYFLDACADMAPIIIFVKAILKYLYIAVGIILIVLITIDLMKAVIAGDEKEVKNAQKAAIRRLVYGVIIFFVVGIVTLIFNLLNSTGGSDYNTTGDPTWKDCWSCKNSDCSERS